MGPPASPPAKEAVEGARENLRASGAASVTPPDLFNAANDVAWESGLLLSQTDVWAAVYESGGYDYENPPADDTLMPLGTPTEILDQVRGPTQYVDGDGQAAWISEHADLPLEVVRLVLDLEFEYMVGVGIVDDPNRGFRYYSRDDFGTASSDVDTDKIAQDAQRLLDVDSGVAERIFETESAFLRMRGLTS